MCCVSWWSTSFIFCLRYIHIGKVYLKLKRRAVFKRFIFFLLTAKKNNIIYKQKGLATIKNNKVTPINKKQPIVGRLTLTNTVRYEVCKRYMYWYYLRSKFCFLILPFNRRHTIRQKKKSCKGENKRFQKHHKSKVILLRLDASLVFESNQVCIRIFKKNKKVLR